MSTLSDQNWREISRLGRLTEDARVDVEREFAQYDVARSTDRVTPKTIDLVEQIDGRIEHLANLIQRLLANNEYRLAEVYSDDPKPDLELLNTSLDCLSLLSDEMVAAKVRLTETKDSKAEDPLIKFFFGLMITQSRCLRRSAPTSEAKSSGTYEFVELCAKTAEPHISRRRFASAIQAAFKMFQEMKNADPENYADYHG